MERQLQTYTPAYEDTDSLLAELTTPAPPPMTLFDLIGVDKAAVLATLYNNAVALYPSKKSEMDYNTAQHILTGFYSCGSYNPPLTDFTSGGRGSCAYGNVSDDGVFMGRKLDVDLSGDELDTSAYDLHNGQGKGQSAFYTALAAIEGGYMERLGSGS